jgi:hypothetical protein
MLLQTHCACSGDMSISLYPEVETYNEFIPDHDCCGHEITDENFNIGHALHSCGCGEPLFTYLKLTNHPGEDSELEYSRSEQLNLAYFPEVSSLQLIAFLPESSVYPEYSPPANPLYGRFLITFLNQRKIALLA